MEPTIYTQDKAIKIKEVATILSVHYQTVWTLIKDGKLKAINVSAGRKAVLQSEINRYLESLK